MGHRRRTCAALNRLFARCRDDPILVPRLLDFRHPSWLSETETRRARVEEQSMEHETQNNLTIRLV